MYEGSEALVVGAAIATAAGAVRKDRAVYAPFLACAERFAADHRMIAGGCRLLLGDEGLPPAPDAYSLELYSAAAFDSARKMAAAMYALDPDGPGRYTTVITNTPNEEFTIAVFGRDLVKVTTLGRGNVASPTMRPALWNCAPLMVPCLPAEVQLIATYAALANPARAGEWAALAATEARLRAVFFAGARPPRVTGGGGDESWQARRARLLAAFARAQRVTHVRVDCGGAPSASSKQYYITPHAFEAEQKLIRAVSNDEHVETHMSVDDPRIPGAPALRRLTVFAIGNPSGRREPVMYVYNSAVYELVPYELRDGVKCGSIFVRLRFALIDLWTAQLLMHLKAITADVANDMIRAIVELYTREAAKIAAAPTDVLFPLNYIGRLENPIIAAKRARLAASHGGRHKPQFYPPYYPAKK